SEIYEYRTYITEEMVKFLDSGNHHGLEDQILLGIHHEKQHQELLLTDIKFILGNNPLFPVYNQGFDENPVQDMTQEWITIPEGIYHIGHQQKDSFCYDNELEQHKIYLQEYKISNKLVSNEEYLEFMSAGGYENVLYWHAEGWDWVKQNKINSPLYWHYRDGEWFQY